MREYFDTHPQPPKDSDSSRSTETRMSDQGSDLYRPIIHRQDSASSPPTGTQMSDQGSALSSQLIYARQCFSSSNGNTNE